MINQGDDNAGMSHVMGLIPSHQVTAKYHKTLVSRFTSTKQYVRIVHI